MPCKYVIANDGDIVLELWTGTMTLEELMVHKQQQFSDPRIRPGAAVLSDCRRASVEISPDEITQLAAMESEPEGQSAISRYAFLVKNDAYERAQLFADQAKQSNKSVILFNTLDAAAAWLGMSDLEVLKLLEIVED